MQAWICNNPVGIDALQWQDLPTPEPQAGQARLAVKAASLNFPDILIVQNKYQFKPALPFVPGSEYSGVVEAAGEGVHHLKPGQRVACLSGSGGFATHAIATAAICMPLPDGFSFVDAAAFIMTFGTIGLMIGLPSSITRASCSPDHSYHCGSFASTSIRTLVSTSTRRLAAAATT